MVRHPTGKKYSYAGVAQGYIGATVVLNLYQ